MKNEDMLSIHSGVKLLNRGDLVWEEEIKRMRKYYRCGSLKTGKEGQNTLGKVLQMTFCS